MKATVLLSSSKTEGSSTAYLKIANPTPSGSQFTPSPLFPQSIHRPLGTVFSHGKTCQDVGPFFIKQCFKLSPFPIPFDLRMLLSDMCPSGGWIYLVPASGKIQYPACISKSTSGCHGRRACPWHHETSSTSSTLVMAKSMQKIFLPSEVILRQVFTASFSRHSHHLPILTATFG